MQSKLSSLQYNQINNKLYNNERFEQFLFGGGFEKHIMKHLN